MMEYKRETQTVICKHCKKEFKKSISEIKRTEKRGYNHYCSKQCDGKSKEITSTRYCLQCGKKIKSQKFCSQSCAASFNNKKRKGEKRTFSNEGMKNILNAISTRNIQNINIPEYYNNPNHCKECNEELIFKHRKRVFCSINCKRQYERKNITEYQKYHKNCSFNFNLSDYPSEFDFELIKKYGWYQAKNHGDNLNGVSRDHMVSIKYGYESNIDPEIIKHPANCRLMIHNDNVSKHKKCSITLEELTKRIDGWNLKYN